MKKGLGVLLVGMLIPILFLANDRTPEDDFSLATDEVVRNDLVLWQRRYVHDAEEAWESMHYDRENGWHCYNEGNIPLADFWFTQGAQGLKFKRDCFDFTTRKITTKIHHIRDPYCLYYRGLIAFQSIGLVKENVLEYCTHIAQDFLDAYNSARLIDLSDVNKFRHATYKSMCMLCGWCLQNNYVDAANGFFNHILDLDIDYSLRLRIKEIIIDNYNLPKALQQAPIEKGGTLILSALYLCYGKEKYFKDAPEKNLKKTPEDYLTRSILFARETIEKVKEFTVKQTAHVIMNKAFVALFNRAYATSEWTPFMGGIFFNSSLPRDHYKTLFAVIVNDKLQRRPGQLKDVEIETKINSLLAFLEEQSKLPTKQRSNYRKLLAHVYLLNEIVSTDVTKVVEFGSAVADDDFYLANFIGCAYAGRLKNTNFFAHDAFKAQKFYKLAVDAAILEPEFFLERLKKMQVYLNPYSFVLDAHLSLAKGNFAEGVHYFEEALKSKILPFPDDKFLTVECAKFKERFLELSKKDNDKIKFTKLLKKHHLIKNN